MKRNHLIKNKIISSFKKNLFLGSLVLTFLVLNIFLSLQTVSSGSKLSGLETKEKDLVTKNRQLNSELVEATSLTQVQRNSQQLGFVKPLSLVYLRDTGSFASVLH
jgi:hypothetical protein